MFARSENAVVYISELEQVQQRPVKWSGTGAQASEERLGVPGLFSLAKAEFGHVRGPPSICEDIIKMAKPDSSQWCMVGSQQHK